MLLDDDGGAEVELHVAGYERPDATVEGAEVDGGGWDANWLVISGAVRTGEGETWSFRDAGLTTWEVAELADWLERAARGDVAAVTGPSDDGADQVDDDDAPWWWDSLHAWGWLVFTEPCLTVGVARQVGGQTAGWSGGAWRVLVGLGAEWGPPPLPEEAHVWVCVELVLTAEQLLHAAADLREQLALHPRR